jgi:hypothetical protein
VNEAAQAGRSLADAGLRLVIRKREHTVVLCTWLEPLLMQPGDIDCTDMTDEQFEDVLR